VGDDDHGEVRHVRVERRDVPQQAIDDDGDRRPVLGVGPEEVAEVAAPAGGEELPLVAEEPPVAPDGEDQDRDGRDGVDAERRARRAAAQYASGIQRCGSGYVDGAKNQLSKP
jgi:hypothetical protein